MASLSTSRISRRERLLESASALFARWGYDKTSVDDIARESGISKGAVYLEFQGKEHLFHAVLYRELERYAEDWRRRFESDSGEWSFARIFQHSLAAIQANPLVRALLTQDRKVFGGFLSRDSELFGAVIALRVDLFGKLQDLGAMRSDIPAPVLAYLISAIEFGIVAADYVIPEGGRVTFPETMNGLGLLLDRGLSPERVQNREKARELILEGVGKMMAMLRAKEAE